MPQHEDGCFKFESLTLPPTWWEHVNCLKHVTPPAFYNELPNDEDLYRIVRGGLHGTPMLPWAISGQNPDGSDFKMGVTNKTPFEL